MPIYNSIEYSGNYSKTSGFLRQYCGDVPAVNDNGEITDLTEVKATTDLFKLKVKSTGQTDKNGSKNVEVAWAATFSITDTKLYVPVVTLSTQDNAKLLEQLKSGFKKTNNWSKRQTKVSTERQNQYLDFLIGPSFQEINRLFTLLYESEAQRTIYKKYYLPTNISKK